MSDSRYWSAAECVSALRRGDVKAVELVDEAIARIEALNPRLNIVVATDFERARSKALAADAALAASESVGPLHGLPITVKDSFETADLVTTCGSPELRDHVPDASAVAVQRLTEAGAIVLGKTNLPLFASDFQSYNDVYGLTRNPWDPERTVGGSSGGAAAALAAGLVPLEIGSDIAGSIRIPAHFCGVYGHKSSHGIIPLRGHLLGPPGTLATPDLLVAGPMALTAGPQPCAAGVGRCRHAELARVEPQAASTAWTRRQRPAGRILVRRSPVPAGGGRTRRARSDRRRAQIQDERRGDRYPLHPRRNPQDLRTAPDADVLRQAAGAGSVSREHGRLCPEAERAADSERRSHAVGHSDRGRALA